MGIEIERKFLVKTDILKDLIENNFFNNKITIKQGYILNSKEKVVRIRITNDKSYITIKGQNKGLSRPEYEYEIPKIDSEEMINTLCSNIIEKTRYVWKNNGNIWEVDIFHGDNEGLILAEVEIPSEDYYIELPNWIDKDVSNDIKYYNNNLIENPYKDWR